MKIARQRVSATKSGNGLQKTLQTISIWRWLLFILFFYFSVVLVVIGEKSPQLWVFPRQPARQRDSNRGRATGCHFQNGSSICSVTSTKPSIVFSGGLPESVAGFSRSQPFCLPYSENILGFGKVPPAGNALVHNLVDFPDFPLLRLVKGVVQGFLVELLGADHAPRCTYQDTPVSSRLWCPPA